MQEDPAEIFIGIGSNLGSRFENVRKALRLMKKDAMTLQRISPIFETEAILPLGAPSHWDLPYFNLVVSGTSHLSPQELLRKLKTIEREMGRDFEAPRWAPRIIDLDILAWDDRIISDETLKIPHPELMNRSFLLGLMASLNPHWRYPIDGFPYSHQSLAEIMHRAPWPPQTHKCFMPFPHLVGIVNITPDSFSDGGKYFHPEKALQQIQNLASQGAAVIDLGAQSTRPGATPVSAEEEWQRLKPVLELLRQTFQTQRAHPKISLDSFQPTVIEQALLHYPLDWINDVQGGRNERLLKIVAETNCSLVLNHSLTVPASKGIVLPFNTPPMQQIRRWAEEKIEQLGKLGIGSDRIILDPGIGFGKSSFQSLELLRHIDTLQGTGCEILIGHSRKSFLKTLTNAADPDMETIGISHFLARKKMDYLRVHNVEAHQRSLTASAFVGGLSDL